MTTHRRSRVPAGITTGGQFATEGRARSAVVLDASQDSELPDNMVSFADFDRTQRLEAMHANLAEAMEDLSDPAAWKRMLNAASHLHKYSLNNQLLISLQRPGATLVAGFNDWKSRHGRKVKKGEKGIWVLAPCTYKVTSEGEDGEETVIGQRLGGFRPVAVFDISQTEPIEGDPRGEALEYRGVPIKPLEGEAPPGMAEGLTTAIESMGYTVRYTDDIPGTASGYTNFDTREVVVRASDSPRERASTLGHEAAHIACGHEAQREKYHTGAGGLRPDMEVEAESVAYVLGMHYGLDDAGQANFGYIDHWAKGDTAKVKATAGTVVQAAKKILDAAESREEAAA